MTMTCEQIEAQGVIEQYVANKLPNGIRKAFEEHYFGCDQCFETLEAYRAGATALRQVGVAKPSRRWIWPAAVAAAAAFAVVTVRLNQHPTPAKVEIAVAGPDLALLAKVEPPAYAPSTLRSIPDAATKRFQAAMEPYRVGNYAGALASLETFLKDADVQKRPFLDGEFFLGALYLLTDRPDDAAAALSKVLSADSPYQEEAHFLMAETWLKKRDAIRARAELQSVVAMNGDFKSAAEQLLAKF